jgi:hypothetical protein
MGADPSSGRLPSSGVSSASVLEYWKTQCTRFRADFITTMVGFRSHGEVDSDRRSGRVRLQTLTLETTMQVIADRPEAPSAIRTNLGAISLLWNSVTQPG